MPKLSVCIEMFWGDLSFEERIKRVGALGIPAAEFWFWGGKDLASIKAAADKAGVVVPIFFLEAKMPAVHPNAAAALVEGAKASVQAAKVMGNRTLMLTVGNERKGESFAVTRHSLVRNLKAALPVLEDAGITLCIEPLNPIVDHLGYWLTKMSDAADIVAEINSPNLKILMDIYHQQITEGNIIDNLRQYASMIGHIHCAGVPGRGDLAGGELDYRSLFKVIDQMGYTGYVGLEFRASGAPEDSLKQAMDLAL